ncbi:hypothetical protein [Escherichia phage E20-1]|nr:hypothetical protein [Escherichia phage E20-1]
MITYVNYTVANTSPRLNVITYVIIYEWIIDVCMFRLVIVYFSDYVNSFF